MSHNTWIHRAVRPAARGLARTAITPNQITWLRLAGGLAAAGALAEGSDLWRNWGAGMYLASFFLDRLDGELARASGRKSVFGHKLDLVSDALCNALAFIGLGLGLMAGQWGGWALPMGLVAGLAIAVILTLVIRLESQAGQRAGELAGAAGFDPDDGMLALPLLIWLGLSDWLLLLAAIGTPAFAVFMLIRFRKSARGLQA